MTTVGELRAFLAKTALPDDAPVLAQGRHSLHVVTVRDGFVHAVNRYGQAEWSVRREDAGEANALFLCDSSTG